MNDYVIYELASQRHAALTAKVRHARAIRSRRYRGSWTSLTTSALQRLAVVAHVLTNRPRSPATDC